MPLCYDTICTKVATQILGDDCFCDAHYLKKKVELRHRKKITIPKEITIEFCCWLQDEDVFSTFCDHLNKGLRLEDQQEESSKNKCIISFNSCIEAHS